MYEARLMLDRDHSRLVAREGGSEGPAGPQADWARTAVVADLSRRRQALDEVATQLGTLGTLTSRRDWIAAERDARQDFHELRGWAAERGRHQPGQQTLRTAA